MAQPSIPTRHNHRTPLMRVLAAMWRTVATVLSSRLFGAVLAAAALVALLVAAFYFRSDSIAHRQDAQAYEKAAGQLAATNNANCEAAGKNCVGNSKQVVKNLPTAVQSVVSPVVTQAPPQKGPPGRGVVSTEVDPDGHLIVHFTDGTKQDAGRVAGAAGRNGRGIRTTAIHAGALVVSYSDGSSKNLGKVVGQAGRGVASAMIVAGHLVIAYTDRTSTDLGPVVGRDGIDGTSVTNMVVDAAGDLQVTLTAADGSTKVIDAGHVVGSSGSNGAAGKDGQPPVSWTEHAPDGSVTQVCQRSSNFDADAPTYQCTAPPPAPSSSASPTPTP